MPQYGKISFSMYLFHLSHSIQSLTTLDLSYNQIDSKGAKHLAHALRHNTVGLPTYSLISRIFIKFNTDIDYVEPQKKSTRP